jgi:hypothetical protein
MISLELIFRKKCYRISFRLCCVIRLLWVVGRGAEWWKLVVWKFDAGREVDTTFLLLLIITMH